MKLFSSFFMALCLSLAFNAFSSPAFAPTSKPPLPAGMAFFSSIEPSSGSGYTVTLIPQEGYYIYRDKIKVTSSSLSLDLPPGETEHDPLFGKVEVYHSPVSFAVSQPHASVEFQGCQKGGICYPPIERELSVVSPSTASAPPAPLPSSSWPVPNEQGISDWLTQASLWQTALVFLGIGLLLSLTPCVFPLLPVVSSIVLGHQTQSFKRSAGLATTYVLSHALVFAGLGIGAALLGKSLTLFFQQEFIVFPVMALMAGVGILMMLGRSIQMPTAIQQWAMRQGQGGTVWGAALLGASSSLILGPCLAPPLAGILLYLGNTHDWVMGGVSLFCLALGMGIPLVMVSLGLKKMMPKLGNKLPNLGKRVNLVLGLALFLTATYLVSLHWNGVWAWAIAALGVVGTQLMLKRKTGQPWVQKSLIMACMGLVLYVPAHVWLSSNGELMAPEKARVVMNAEELSNTIRSAPSSSIVMVDFYADWCVECLRMEKTTFKDEQVKAFMKAHGITSVTVDLTDMNDEKEQLLKTYGVIGPPVILFYQNGEEKRDLRITGYQQPQGFLHALASASPCEQKTVTIRHTC